MFKSGAALRFSVPPVLACSQLPLRFGHRDGDRRANGLAVDLQVTPAARLKRLVEASELARPLNEPWFLAELSAVLAMFRNLG